MSGNQTGQGFSDSDLWELSLRCLQTQGTLGIWEGSEIQDRDPRDGAGSPLGGSLAPGGGLEPHPPHQETMPTLGSVGEAVLTVRELADPRVALSEHLLWAPLLVLAADHCPRGLHSWTPSTEPGPQGSLGMPMDHPAPPLSQATPSIAPSPGQAQAEPRGDNLG